MGLCMDDDHFSSHKYYHLDCFSLRPLFKDIDPNQQIYRFDDLENKDQELVIARIEAEQERLKKGIKKAKKPAPKAEAAKNNQKKKKKAKSEEEESEEQEYQDSEEEEVKPKKKSKAKSQPVKREASKSKPKKKVPKKIGKPRVLSGGQERLFKEYL